MFFAFATVHYTLDVVRRSRDETDENVNGNYILRQSIFINIFFIGGIERQNICSERDTWQLMLLIFLSMQNGTNSIKYWNILWWHLCDQKCVILHTNFFLSIRINSMSIIIGDSISVLIFFIGNTYNNHILPKPRPLLKQYFGWKSSNIICSFQLVKSFLMLHPMTFWYWVLSKIFLRFQVIIV